MSKNTLKIQELRQKHEPLQNKLFEAIKQASLDVAKRLNKTINPVYPVSTRVGIDGITFFTTTEATEKGVNPPYADFGSEITLSNNYGFGNFDNMENIFIPELGYSSLRMSFDEKGKKYQVTKFQVLHFLSNEILNDGEFTQYLKKTFHDLRLLQKEVWKIEFELRPLIEEDKKIEIDSLKEACQKSLKEGNWYKNEKNFYFIEKITPKKVFIIIMNMTRNMTKVMKEEQLTANMLGAVDILFDKELTTDVPEEVKNKVRA